MQRHTSRARFEASPAADLDLDTPSTDDLAEHVLVFAASPATVDELCGMLMARGVACRSFVDGEKVAERLDEANAGALLLTEEVLTPAAVRTLVVALENQPQWSDLPVIVVANGGAPAPAAQGSLELLRAVSSATVLTRDSLLPTLTATLQSRLAARRRQYAVRDLLARERAARRQAEQASAEREQLFFQLCHELQTPVSAILLWSRLAAAGTMAPQELRRALATIESSARAQSYHINTLADAAALAADRLRLSLQPTPLGQAVEAALSAIRGLAAFKGVGLVVELDPPATPALVDTERIQRVIWTLLERAIKRTPAGEAVGLRLGADQAGQWIEVSDHGERGNRDVRHAAREVGLTVARGIIELHGGRLEVEDGGSGTGTVVSIVVPARAAVGQSSKDAAAPGDA